MQILKVKSVHNHLYHIIGAIIHILNYIRHKMQGYRTPRTFSIQESERATAYDFGVVDGWLRSIQEYTNNQFSIHNKTVLEIGPGDDLGNGLIFLAMGAKKYFGLDIHNLASTTPQLFYDTMFKKLQDRFPHLDLNDYQNQIEKSIKGNPDKLHYIVDKTFQIDRISGPIDLVVSQAVFQSLDDVDTSIMQLSKIVNTGACFIAVIDLKTHTRWIRDVDPLNIYRYGRLFWNRFHYRESSNRTKIQEYISILKNHGWINVSYIPLAQLEPEYVEKIKPSLNKKFRSEDTSHIQLLSIALMAQKG
ncbi:MAG: hypothetical protein JW795_13575 [Chitinivibrionales bacterium]|nr:hypothetical protein [Chitinivibrionales bacterium]